MYLLVVLDKRLFSNWICKTSEFREGELISGYQICRNVVSDNPPVCHYLNPSHEENEFAEETKTQSFKFIRLWYLISITNLSRYAGVPLFVLDFV